MDVYQLLFTFRIALQSNLANIVWDNNMKEERRKSEQKKNPKENKIQKSFWIRELVFVEVLQESWKVFWITSGKPEKNVDKNKTKKNPIS